MFKESLKALVVKTIKLDSPAWLRESAGNALFWASELVYLSNPRHLQLRRFLGQSQWWTAEALRRYQLRELKRVLRYAYHFVPYYGELFRKLKLTPDDFKSIDTLKHIPILTKDLIVKHQDKLISREINKKYLESFTTSGSTGSPAKFFFDRRSRYISHEFWLRAHSGMGICNSRRNLWIWLTPFILSDNNAPYVFHPHQKKLWLSAFPEVKDFWEEKLKLIRKFDPENIRASASLLYDFACYAKDRGLTGIKPACFVSYFDNLFPHQRECIEGQFHRKVYNYYGSVERVVSAFECREQKGMHLDMERCVTEIIGRDGGVLPAASPGSIVVTGLCNFAMPLIRYEIGDIGSISGRPCPCGRGLAFLESLDGRTSEVIRFRNKFIYPSPLSVAMRQFSGVKECQFIQEKDDELIVNIVKRQGFTELEGERIVGCLQALIDKKLAIKLCFTDAIARTKMGKFPFVVSKIKEAA